MTEAERIKELESLLATALARIAELEAQILKLLAKTTKKTSKNSHTPPSADIKRKNRSLRGKSDKPTGGQKGHKGTTLEMSTTPDKVESLYPNYCNECGSSLQENTFELVTRRQVIDIPPIVPVVTEYQCFGTTCQCGPPKRIFSAGRG